MRVELPEGYVPPEPTHPLYGYLTPEEREAFEAQERARLGIVPGVVEEAEVEEPRSRSAEERRARRGGSGRHTGSRPSRE